MLLILWSSESQEILLCRSRGLLNIAVAKADSLLHEVADHLGIDHSTQPKSVTTA